MKKFLFIAALVFSFVACEEDKTIEEIQHTNNKCEDLPFEEESEPETEFYIDIVEEDLIIYAGQTYQLKLVIEGTAPGEITWTSDDERVISVDENGVITANEEGCATIFVNVDGNVADAVFVMSENERVYFDIDVNNAIQDELFTVNVPACGAELVLGLTCDNYNCGLLYTPECESEIVARIKADPNCYNPFFTWGSDKGIYHGIVFKRNNLNRESVFLFEIFNANKEQSCYLKVIQGAGTETETGVKVVKM